MSGGGSDIGIGPIDSNTPCDRLKFEASVTSPDPQVVARLSKGDIAFVEIHEVCKGSDPFFKPLSALVCVLLFASAVRANVDDEELHREASWEYPSAEVVKFDLDVWLEQQRHGDETLDDEIMEQIAGVWQDAEQSIGADLLQRVAQTIGLADAEAAAFIGVCLAPWSSISAPDCALLTDEATPSVVRDNLRLIWGA